MFDADLTARKSRLQTGAGAEGPQSGEYVWPAT